MMYYKGDIVEIINYDKKYSEDHWKQMVGQRFRIKHGQIEDQVYLDGPQNFMGMNYGWGTVAPSNVILYKRPFRNWIKIFFGIKPKY
jgi:hypothetical protein